MFTDRVSKPGPLTYESCALPIALRGPFCSLISVSILFRNTVFLVSILERGIINSQRIVVYVTFLVSFIPFYQYLAAK